MSREDSEEEQYTSSSTDWPLPSSSTKNYKTWMDALRRYLIENNPFPNRVDISPLTRYENLSDVYVALKTFGLDVDLYHCSPALKNCNLRVFPNDPKLQSAVDGKFESLWSEKFPLERDGLNIKLFSQKHPNLYGDFNPGRRLAHAIVDSQSNGEDQVVIESWDHQGYGSHRTWYKILSELPVVDPHRFGMLEKNEREQQKDTLRKLLFDFEIIITCEFSNRYKKLTDEKKGTTEINPITFNFIKLKNGSMTKLPVIEDFGMIVPPINAFYDDVAEEYVRVNDATDKARQMLQRFLEEHNRIDKIMSNRFQETMSKILNTEKD